MTKYPLAPRLLLLKLLAVVFVACLLAGCGPDGNSFRINGTFRDMQAGELYIYNPATTQACFDTLTVRGGRFTYEGQASTVLPYMLVFPNGMEQVIFVGPGQELDYEASANDLKNYVVSGSEENKLIAQFHKETYTLTPPQVTATARNYIVEYPESPASVYLLDRYFIQADGVTTEELSQLLPTVLKQHPHNHLLLETESRLRYSLHLLPGAKLPDTPLTRRDHTTTQLWAADIQPTTKTPLSPLAPRPLHLNIQPRRTLILFWSTWMHDGYDLIWRLRQQANDSLSTRIVAISLDVELQRWLDATRSDSTSAIEHYCDGLGFESPAAKTLGASRMPYYILTDPQHHILERGHDLADLNKLLKGKK